jgi:hypothetical protein
VRRDGGVPFTCIDTAAAKMGSSSDVDPSDRVRPGGNQSPTRRVRLRTTGELSVGSERGEGPYRYLLTRRWGRGALLAFVMLNPSTADAAADDPTIRRCIGFARREGAGGIAVVNLYALRSPKPAGLLGHSDPEGPLNEQSWRGALGDHRVGGVVAAWGAYAPRRLPASRALSAHRGSERWLCLGRTSDGSPRHPLYAPGDTPLVRWSSHTSVDC